MQTAGSRRGPPRGPRPRAGRARTARTGWTTVGHGQPPPRTYGRAAHEPAGGHYRPRSPPCALARSMCGARAEHAQTTSGLRTCGLLAKPPPRPLDI
eukprot:2743626-Pleurochrysis_carterae.AAC.1